MAAPRRWPMIGCAVAIAAASACFRTSPSPDHLVTSKLKGDAVALYYGTGLWIDGELLAVTDSSFVVMRDRVWSESQRQGSATTFQLAHPSGVIVVPRRSIRRIEFGLRSFDTPGGALTRTDLENVARRSRFPYGLSADAMAQLLRASGQATPDTLVWRSP